MTLQQKREQDEANRTQRKEIAQEGFGLRRELAQESNETRKALKQMGSGNNALADELKQTRLDKLKQDMEDAKGRMSPGDKRLYDQAMAESSKLEALKIDPYKWSDIESDPKAMSNYNALTDKYSKVLDNLNAKYGDKGKGIVNKPNPKEDNIRKITNYITQNAGKYSKQQIYNILRKQGGYSHEDIMAAGALMGK
jgi:hypothetical protein